MTIESSISLLAMAVTSGLVGCFAVMRRMSLAADPLSHVALPGIGIALALHMNPMLGAASMLVFGALLVWGLEERSRAATEAVIGVVFSTALAAGSLMSSGEELIDSLFGSAGSVGRGELFFGLALASSIAVFILANKNSLVVMLVSPDVARTSGIPVRRLNLFYLEAFALTIALGLRYLGVLLMGALIIVPAVTAKHLARNLRQMLWFAIGLSVFAAVAGMLLASDLHREPGPMIVLVAAGAFLLSLLFRR